MIYTISSDKLKVDISTLGAELQSIKTADGTEYLWQGDKKYWDGKAINLFPYIARLTQGKYTYRRQAYSMNIHGFVPYMELEQIKQNENSISFRLLSSDDTKVQYPFDFEYIITYLLEDAGLSIRYQVTNRGADLMYFAVGGHPGFNVPLEDGAAFEDYYLEFSRACQPVRIGFSKDCYLNGSDMPFELEQGKRIALSHALFDDDAIVLRDMDREICLMSKYGERKVIVRYPQMDFLGIWHCPKSDAPYICIEPWSSLPSRDGIIEDLEQQENLISLPGGQVYENIWSIQII